ncbi:MAG TPA: transcription antitermination factor NusB [Longimicrobiales bacterium]|nr:transcription antitermination factor NusB [Longimicrobiales bacterium]
MRERSRAREWALRVLYAWESRADGDLTAVLEEFMTRRLIAPGRRAYMRRLVERVAAECDTIDRELESAVTNWRFDRLAAMDRNVLRLAAAEMLYFDDIPPRVSIQEALRLAEKYGTDQSPRFVNGVLDALMRRLDPT